MVDMNSLTTRTFPFLQSYFPTYLHSHSHNSPLHLMQNFPILHNTNPTTMDRGGGGGGDYYYYHHHHHHTSPEGSLRSDVSNTSGGFHQPTPPSRYESQKRRDWNTFGQYLKNQRPPVALSQCTCNHVLDFLRYLDQFGKTKVHLQGCMFYGQPEPPAPCACPLRQAWGSLDALIGRLRAAYEENGGSPETNPFASSGIRVYLREVRDSQAKARGIPYKKKKKNPPASTSKGDHSSSPSSSSSTSMHFS